VTNKTFIPAFKAKVGDWDYYICVMKYAEVARQVGFAYELGGNADLNTLIQRGLSHRTQAIKDYLMKSEHRFLGALLVAAWGGAPQYMSVSMDDPDGVLSGIDKQFGVLTFDGTQQYFALDGQHRLKAIKEALKSNPEIGQEDICVIMVSHYDTEEGKVRTRRLFTNINRNAKATTGAENIVLDEDDGPAIVTRRLITEHPFFSAQGVIKVFIRQGEEGELKLASGNVSQSEKRAFTTIANLYDMVRSLCFGLDPAMQKRDARPSDDVLESAYVTVGQRLDDLLKATGNIRESLLAGMSAKDLRFPKNNEAGGHAFMRPVIQKAVARAAAQIAEQDVLPWNAVMERLSKLPWQIGQAPWTAVFNTSNNKMVTAKENVTLLDDLVYAHVAAPSKQFIINARKEYKQVRGSVYPVSEEDLLVNLVNHSKKVVVEEASTAFQSSSGGDLDNLTEE
jgi:DNA sulfur modification protein DndB